MISSRQFSYYLRLLYHPDKRQRIDALQDIFFSLLRGELLHPNQWEQLIPALVVNIACSRDDTLRRWAYQVGTFSINNNNLLVDYCVNSFDREKNTENRLWIAALLSKNLSKERFYKVLSRSDHRLSDENIALATYLFTDYSIVNVHDVFKRSDPLSLMWLSLIGAFKNIAVHNKREVIVTPKELSQLTSETDNDEVLKYVMGAFYLQESFNIQELRFSPFEYNKMGNQQKKWFFSLIWKDKQFLLSNIDYFRELLSEKHLFHDINPEVRIGLARGLVDSDYSADLSDSIIEWYSHEDRSSALYYLLQHFRQNQHLSTTYKEIVEFQRENGRDVLKDLISVHEKTEKQITSNEILPANLFCIGSKGALKMEVNFNNASQVNVFEGDYNKVFYAPPETTNWETMKSELEEIIQKCDNDRRRELEDALKALEKKDEEGLKAVLMRVVKFGSSVFSNVTANMLTAYMRANGIIP